jgi:hypothetical protein
MVKPSGPDFKKVLVALVRGHNETLVERDVPYSQIPVERRSLILAHKVTLRAEVDTDAIKGLASVLASSIAEAANTRFKIHLLRLDFESQSVYICDATHW